MGTSGRQGRGARRRAVEGGRGRWESGRARDARAMGGGSWAGRAAREGRAGLNGHGPGGSEFERGAACGFVSFRGMCGPVIFTCRTRG